MGADIHFYIETRSKPDEPWTLDTFHGVETFEEECGIGEPPETVTEISSRFDQYGYGGRNYGMFGILADVRRDGVIYAPRGVPDDLSEALAKEVEKWDGDGHSHSHLTLDEFKECLDKYKALHQETASSYEHIYELASNWLIKEQAEAKLLETGLDPQIRFVFFFDN